MAEAKPRHSGSWMKFYEPTTGEVLIDGQNISTCSINSVRKQLALVSQDIFIFDASARDNIGYGRDGASEAEIIAGIEAMARDFVEPAAKL